MALDESVTSTARALAQDAEQDFKDGRYADAGDKFSKAYQAVRVPTLARSAARAFVQQGKLVRASELYRQALLLQPNELWVGTVQQDAQAKAKEELAALMPRLGRLKLQVQGAPIAEVEIVIDEVRIPNSLLGASQYIDPGEHNIVAKRGEASIHQLVTVAEGGQEEATIEFTAANQAASGAVASDSSSPAHHASKANTQRVLGWVGLGLGATGLVVGATTGLMVMVKHQNLQSDCANNVCDRDKVSASSTDSYNSLRTVSTIGFVAGVAGAAVGVTLLLTAPAAEKPSVGVWFGPAATGIRGAF